MRITFGQLKQGSRGVAFFDILSLSILYGDVATVWPSQEYKSSIVKLCLQATARWTGRSRG